MSVLCYVDRRSNPYLETKIYKLTCPGYPWIYIGTTHDTLDHRFRQHASKHRSWKRGKIHFTASFLLFEKGPCVIELIENYPCQTKRHMLDREQHWMRIHRYTMINLAFETNSLTAAELNEFRDRCVPCECGVSVLPNQMDAHLLSMNHLNNLRKAAQLPILYLPPSQTTL